MHAMVRGVVIPLALCIPLLGMQPAQAATPAPVTGVAVSTTETTATVSWDPSARAAHGYRACLKTNNKPTTSCKYLTAKDPRTSWTFEDLSPTAGTDFFAIIFSYNASGRSESDPYPVNLAPPAATNLSATTTTTSATISWKGSAYRYQVCLLPGKKSTECSYQSPKVRSSSFTFDGLESTSGRDYFARVDSFRAGVPSASLNKAFDLQIGRVSTVEVPDLQPESIQVQWTPATNADRYLVEVSTNSAFSENLRQNTTSGAATSITIGNLKPGVVHFARVRGFTKQSTGDRSPALKLKLPTAPFDTSVMTFNLCGQNYCVTSGNKMKFWSVRKPLAGTMARRQAPDIIATQESHHSDTNFITELPGYSQGAYKSSKTIFYRRDVYRRLTGGNITLDSKRGKYAVWNKFRHRATGSRVIVVDAHLQPYKGKTNDELRKTQTRKLIAAVENLNRYELPVVYAGDFNSNESNTDQSRYPGGFDAPAEVFEAAGLPDTFDLAEHFSNKTYNSANQATNPPARHSHHIDRIFITADITVKRWREVISRDQKARDQGINLYSTPFASDHNPVIAELTIPGLPGQVG